MKQPARPLQVNNPYSNQKANKPGFLDFLNPFGEHGLFGTKQQQRFNNVTQPATKAIEDYQKNIDKGDNKPGFQWNDVGDYVRFAQKLPAGMVGGVLESPNKVAASVSGKHVDQTGKVSDKTLAQRAAMLADGYIGTAGLAMGASGKLLKSLGANLGKEAVKQTAKTGLKQGLKDFAKGVASEGLEEASQSLLGEIGERGYLDHQSLGRAIEAGKMGMLGGAIMDGAGKAISGVHSAYNNFKAPARPTLRRVDNPYSYQGSVRNKIDENWEKSRTPQQIALAEALDEAAGVKQPVSFGQLDAEKLKTLNELMLDRSQNIANNPDILVHPNVVAKLRNKRIIQEGLTPEQVADTAFSAIHNNDSRILPSKYPHIATIAKLKSGASPQANLGVYDDAISLKSVYDKNARAIVAEANKNLLPKAAGLSSLEGGTDPLFDLAPEDANGRAPISARQTTYNPNIPQNAKVVNPYSYDESTKLKQADNPYGLSDEDLDFLKNSKNVRLGTDSPEMYALKKRSGLSWNKLSQLHSN